MNIPPPPSVSIAQRSTAQSGLLLLLGVVAFAVFGVQQGWGVYLVFAGLLAAVIMLHEAGHYVAAKAGGMKVTQFFLGFGPKIWSFQRGETEYGVKALPLGGYVRIIGMHNLDKVDPVDEPRSYRQASFPRRVAVAAAGSTVHAVIAFVLLVVLYGPLGQVRELDPTTTIDQVSAAVDVGTAEERLVPSPASEAGLRAGDRIVAVAGRPVRDWRDVALALQAAPDRTIDIDIERDGSRQSIAVTPVAVPLGDGTSIGRVGIQPVIPTVVDRQGLGEAIGTAASQERTLAADSVRALASFFRASNLKSYSDEVARAGSGRQPAVAPEEQNRFVSPVGAARIADDLYRAGGVRDLVWLMIVINVSVGVLNMIPLLPFDGGHLAIAIYERLRSRKDRRYRVDVVKLMPLTYAVVTILVLIGLSSMYLDVVRPARFTDDAPARVPPATTVVDRTTTVPATAPEGSSGGAPGTTAR